MMRAIRFHSYGEPLEVLHLEEAEPQNPGPGRIRVTVRACGLNPADWALCRGLFAGNLPRGIGLEVSGVVDAVGADVADVAIGDAVLGCPDFANQPSAGAADLAVLEYWTRIPKGMDFVQAASLPMAVTTAHVHLAALDIGPNQTLLVHGAGAMVGFAAVQMALMRGARVIATAGETFADRLRAMGAEVTSYGDGMVARVMELVGKPVDKVLDASPVGGSLPDLIKIAGNDPRRVLTVTNFDEADKLGARGTFTDGLVFDYSILEEYARYASEGKFTIPIAQKYSIENWRSAALASLNRQAHGKLILMLADH